MKNMRRIFVILAAFLLLTGIGATTKAAAKIPVGRTSTQEWDVIKLVNKERVKRGLRPLSAFASLQKAADIRAKETVKLFSHSRPSGQAFYTVLQEAGVKQVYGAGENIAAGYSDSVSVVKGWMQSQGHKENILYADYAHLGVGYYKPARATYASYWTQNFLYGSDCQNPKIAVQSSKTVSSCKVGTTINSLNRVLAVKCSHGTSYLPIINEMCKGYNKNKTGVQTVTVKYGTKKASFKVSVYKLTNIKGARITNIKTKKYTGKSLTQSPRVTLKGKVLKKGRDYKLTYRNNKKVGTATVLITGTGKYSGTIKKAFKIRR